MHVSVLERYAALTSIEVRSKVSLLDRRLVLGGYGRLANHTSRKAWGELLDRVPGCERRQLRSRNSLARRRNSEHRSRLRQDDGDGSARQRPWRIDRRRTSCRDWNCVLRRCRQRHQTLGGCCDPTHHRSDSFCPVHQRTFWRRPSVSRSPHGSEDASSPSGWRLW